MKLSTTKIQNQDGLFPGAPFVTIDYSVSGEYEEFGVPDHDWVVLETSLIPGDLVVVDPGGSLRDGMKVRVIIASEVALE